MLFRQGDIFIESISSIPPHVVKRPDLVLAEGEATGHRHRVNDRACSADLYERDGEMFLDVHTDEATVIHDEHDTIVVPRGRYRVWRQREYDPSVPLRAFAAIVPRRSRDTERQYRPVWD